MLFYINIYLNKILINLNRIVEFFKGQSSSSDLSILMFGYTSNWKQNEYLISQAEETSFISRIVKNRETKQISS